MKKRIHRKRRKVSDTLLRRLIVFTVTFLIGLLLFGVIAVGYLLMTDNELGQQSSGESSAGGTQSPNSLNLLIVIGRDELQNGEGIYLLVRYDFKNQTVPVTLIPQDTAAAVENNRRSLSEHYKYGGLVQLKKAVQSVYKVPVDRTAVMNADSFSSIVDKFGGLAYDVPEDIQYQDGASMKVEAGLQTLTGVMVGQLLIAGDGQNSLAAQLVCAFHNQYLHPDTLQNAESLYNYCVNNITTDFSYTDFLNALPGFESVAGAQDPSYVVLTSGEWEQDGFTPDSSMLDAVAKAFKGENEPVISGVD